MNVQETRFSVSSFQALLPAFLPRARKAIRRAHIRCAMVVYLCGAALALAGAVKATPPDVQIPADVQAIMAKARTGTAPSPAERQRLKDWAQKQGHGPKTTAPSVVLIPADVVGTVSYRRSQDHPAAGQPSKNVTASYTFTAPATMAVQANDGAGDWWASTLGATHPGASHFILSPDPDRKGSVNWTGTGETKSPGISTKWKGTSHAKANIILELSTTGKGDDILLGGTLTSLWVDESDAALDEDTTFIDVGTEGSKDTTHTERKHLKGRWDSYTASDPQQEVQPWFMESLHHPQFGQPSPGATLPLSYLKLTEIIASGKPGKLMGDEDFSFKSPDGEVVMGHSHVELRLRPPMLKIKALLVPDTNLESWIPEGPTPKRPEGNNFTAHVELVDTTTGKPPDVQVKGVDFRLVGVSAIPGVCGNWPAKTDKAYETKPDLFFAPKYNRTISAEQQEIKLDKQHWMDKVIVSSRDFGAYGSLKATIELEQGDPLEAQYEKLDRDELPLPLDEDKNHIADAWKPGLNLNENADDENTPSMRRKGDGLTVYEEYRGLLISEGRHPIPADDEKHVRLDPKQRELIVVIEVTAAEAPIVEAGIRIFEKASGIKVLAVASEDRMGPMSGDKGRPRLAILNAPLGSHSSEFSYGTAGAWITSKADPPHGVATTYPIMSDEEQQKNLPDCFGSPNHIKYVAVGKPVNASETVKTLIWYVDPNAAKIGNKEKNNEAIIVGAQLSKAGVSTLDCVKAVMAAANRQDELIAEMAVFAVAHELGHVVGAFHHGQPYNMDRVDDAGGDADCPMRYWQEVNQKGPTINAPLWLPYFTGAWHPDQETPHHTHWKFCDECRAKMSVSP